MIGVGERKLHVFEVFDGYVRRMKEAVYDHGVIAFAVGHVAITAGGALFAARVIERAGNAVGKKIRGEGLCPIERTRAFFAVEIHGGRAREIVIEIAAGEAVIPFVVFRFHIGKEHVHLCRADFVAAAVCGKMYVVQHEFLAVFCGNTADGVAPVKIEQFAQRRGNRKRTAYGGGNRRF